ncbi:MAG: response regulator [Verrucomicrobia bacterium]|nr:response regulator [Verrucomicrobiota bacterium]
MILVVDDDKVLTQLVKTLLEDAGYEVRIAHDGESAYKHLKDPKCRGMLLDIRMPGVNGAELLMLMAAEKIEVPVIVMSGFPDYDEEEMKQFPNVKRLFHKPLYPEDLLSAVNEFVVK